MKKDIVHDLDGWQKPIQDEEDDEEDLKYTLQPLEDVPSATVSSDNPEEWAQEQRGDFGVVYRRKPSVQLKIEGHYLPNSSGCAQTEGVYKIPLSEKRKYLPQYTKA